MPQREPFVIKAHAEEIPNPVGPDGRPIPRHPDDTHRPFVQVLDGTPEERDRAVRAVMSGQACSHCLSVFFEPPGPGKVWRRSFRDNVWAFPPAEAQRLVRDGCCPNCATPCTPEHAQRQLASVVA